MKRILFLGGALQQIPAIKKAKELGHYVITCDYLPNNPGHKFADEYHNVSTTDKEKVLELAKTLSLDGVVAYASDPAALTAAYVCETLGLPTSPMKSVEILSRKDLFRAFLTERGFRVPKAKGYTEIEAGIADYDLFRKPIMVKPVDSSGSKGVVKVSDKSELRGAIEEALSYSRSGIYIIEEFIQKKGYQISGDGFSVDGKLVFASYGNELYQKSGMRDYVAMGEFWPTLFPKEIIQKLNDQLQRLITELNMQTTAYNIEAIVDENDEVYILEFAPRNGGSYIPQLIQYATGVDLVEYTVKAAIGEDCSDLCDKPTVGFWSNYMIFSKKSGKFVKIRFEEGFEQKNLLEVHCTASVGDEVHAYSNTTNSLGTVLFKAETLEEITEITDRIENYMEVVVE